MKDDWLEKKLTEENESNPEQMQAIWDAAQDAEIPFEVDVNKAWTNLEPHLEQQKKPKLWIWPIAAALILGLSIPFWNRSKTYKTSPGQNQNIELTDGSNINLNAQSELTIPTGFNQNHRDVYLSGEAFFLVTKGQHPFHIETQFADVTVVGTQFNVKSTADFIEVGVQEGHVKVTSDLNEAVLDLTQGQWLRVTNLGEIYQKSNLPIENWPPWQYDLFYFDRTPLKHALKEASAHFGHQITCNESIQNELVSGLIEAKDVKTFSDSIAVLLGKEVKSRNNQMLIE